MTTSIGRRNDSGGSQVNVRATIKTGQSFIPRGLLYYWITSRFVIPVSVTNRNVILVFIRRIRGDTNIIYSESRQEVTL